MAKGMVNIMRDSRVRMWGWGEMTMGLVKNSERMDKNGGLGRNGKGPGTEWGETGNMEGMKE